MEIVKYKDFVDNNSQDNYGGFGILCRFANGEAELAGAITSYGVKLVSETARTFYIPKSAVEETVLELPSEFDELLDSPDKLCDLVKQHTLQNNNKVK